MKYISIFLLFVCAASFAAEKPLTITPHNDTTPPSCTITINVVDASAAKTAQLAAIAETTKANAVPGAVQKDAERAGKMAYAAALIPSLYQSIERLQRVSKMTDAEITAQATAAKAAADAQAEALKASRPDVK